MSDKPRAGEASASLPPVPDPALHPGGDPAPILGWAATPAVSAGTLEAALCHSLAVLFTQSVQQQATTALIGQQALHRQLQQLDGINGLAGGLTLGRLAEALGLPPERAAA